MNKTLHIFTYMLLLLGVAVPHSALAQDKPKVMILGNIYGGGELAQVVAKDAATAEEQLIQDADLADLFTTHADHTYTTYVHLGENAEIYGQVFGGGMGAEDSNDGEGHVIESNAGSVTGQTDVALDGATVWSEIFGGGQMADVRGNTLVHFKKGKAGHNAFGGGLGKLDENEEKPDNQREVKASADIKTITDWTVDKLTGESFVVFDGEEVDNGDGTKTATYTHYEFKKARTVNRDGDGNAVMIDGKYYTETDQFHPENPEQLFSINHNIYGGGKTASKVEGKTFVHINYGMVNDEMLNFEHEVEEDGKQVKKKVWSMIYNSIANAQFCVFGGGYGYHTDILGDANVTMDVQGSGQYKYINDFTKSFTDSKNEYHWDTNVGEPELIYQAAEASKWSHGAPGRSCMDIVGGGYNGKVHGTANVTVGGDVVLRKVYGGGYYASVGNTDVKIKSGIFNRVYGGGLIGNVYGTATTNIGQRGTSQSIHDQNLHLLVKDAIYGGNDVSGTVGTSAAVNHTNAAGVTYHVYNPVDADDKGVRMKIYGGLVLGDVYGAGNGNHTGYGNPDYMEFGHSQHPSENYRTLAHAGVSGATHVYKYRPRTARVVMSLQGNAGTDFKDDPQVDKVRIWGRTFGGGNSCNVGVWDGTADDNTEVYADNGSSWHPGDNFTGGGTIEINVGSHVQFGNRNDSHETPNGLFMGSNGEHMITQHLDPVKARYYHQYWDSKAGKYYPGFVVYEDDANTPIKRTTGLKAFKAFINNILTKSNNVRLNIKNLDDETAATDVWMSNFVGGGYRGSMQAATENGSFSYTLPEGVTVGHSVVGGAFNAHIIYRVYATEYGDGTYRTDDDGNYMYETIEPTDHPVISKAEAEKQGLTEYDYIKKLYAEGHEGDEAYKTGYLRYNFDGGMLAHDSEMNATNTGSRIHQVHNPTSLTTADFTADEGYIANKGKALVHLNLKNRLHPAVHEADLEAGTELNVHGGIVYGGCFLTGYVEGDSWVDYDCSLSPLCTDTRFFSKENKQIYDEVADLTRNNALNVFGAGYGTDTHSMGDVYLCIKSIGNQTSDPGDHDSGHENSNYPFIYNAFGGGNMGTVAGSTNVYYDGGKQGTMLGSLYGGGYKGDIGGNTFVELVQGFLVNVYGGSRQANIGGAAHVWAYDGSTRSTTGIADDEYNHLIICNMYGGNDISGSIKGTMKAIWTQDQWQELEGKRFNSYIQVSGTNPGTKGFPLVGNLYGGGNGENWSEELGAAPNVAKSFLEIDGGTTLSAFGGGNKATITDEAWILVNATRDNFADVSFTDYQKEILKNKFFKGVQTGYEWNGNELKMSKHHVDNIFGGNNVATMTIQPKWNLMAGRVGNVYSGGNMGDMTYYNALAGTAGHEDELKGLSIEVNSDHIYIESLYGGCRMSDVRAKDSNGDDVPASTFGGDYYGATVNVIKGNIGNVYGGNDISGYVYNGTNVNLSGSITGNVYGAGNGNYLYAYDKENAYTTAERPVVEKWNEDIDKYVYWVKREGDNAHPSALQLLTTLNNARPHVAKAYLNIKGKDAHDDVPAEKVYISGSVYCGGNASTIRPKNGIGNDAKVKFNIGDNVIVNEVFMGSNGESMKYDANGKSTYLVEFEKVNDLDFKDEILSTDWTSLTGDDDLTSMTTDLRDKLYPNLLSVYMRAVDMKAMPIGFSEFSVHDFKNTTWIGTFCMGGNAGSMLTDLPVDIVFPQSLNFFGRIIGGCKDASFQYKGLWHRGGFRMPLADDATLDDAPTKTKLRMKIRGDWYSRRMNMDPKYKNAVVGEAPEGDYLVYDKTDNGVDWKIDGKAWHDGCNVYGGCYQSGDMVGDVQIYIESDMLAYSRYLHDTTNSTFDDYKRLSSALDESNSLNLPVANVYGAGYGPESRSYGDAYIYMKDIPNVEGWNHPSVNNIFGGGRNGMLIGNSVIHVHDGLVFKDVVGGSFAANMYGSSQVTIGYPKFYVCKKTGEYFLDRADKWNEGYMTKGSKGNESVIKKSIKYFEGTYVPCNIYEQITGVKVSTNDVLGELTSIGDYLKTNKEKDNDYFEFHNEYDDSNDNQENFFPQGGWNSVDIRVCGGVYGGGFSLSNSTAAIAGSYTTLASTPEYNHGTDSQGNSSVGFGGNSSIIITDKGTTKDHIKISTETTKKDGSGNVIGEYTGVGGVYGDGRLVFCEGFRTAELNGYGYAGTTPDDNALMLNSLQRFDLLTVNDCCFKLYGDHDFAIDELNNQKYSLARIGELRMNSSIPASDNLVQTQSTTKAPAQQQAKALAAAPVPAASPSSPAIVPGASASGSAAARRASVLGSTDSQVGIRNYIGFYNNIHYLGAIVTNDDFHEGKFHDATGAVDSNDKTYYERKQEYITNYYASSKDEAATSTFKERNYATARNMVGINSGYCLRVENQYYNGEERKTYYGPIVGVAEVKLLKVQPGEGGGYVYADNIHADTYDKSNPETATFMNESGNFVFEGVMRPGESETQLIVDDCLPKGFDESASAAALVPGASAPGSADSDQHYWYVIGNTYYYNSTLTAFSYNAQSTFDLIDSDPNIIFAGIEDGSEVSLESVKWLPQTSPYPNGYVSDIRGGRDAVLLPLSGDDKYKFTLQIGDEFTWNKEMPRSTNADDDTEKIPQDDKPTGPYTAADGKTLPSSPRFNVQLLDNVNNCPEGEEEYYFNKHLSVPEKVQFIIKSRKGDETKTYNVTLEIVYIQGPSFTGNVLLKNCALPGERIGFSSDGINIKTTDQLPVTGYGWKLVPLKSETLNNVTGKMEYEWDTPNAITIPSSYYQIATNGSVEGSIPALYSQNHWNIFYTFNAGGKTFTVEPTKDEEKPLNERMLVVHNYHKMADIATKYDVTLAPVPAASPSDDPAPVPAAIIYAKALKPGAMIYLADAYDLAAFVSYVNATVPDASPSGTPANSTEGMHFYLQNDLTLPAALVPSGSAPVPDASASVITNPFAGTLHGNGYVLSLTETEQQSLFGANLTGKVYNLGFPNGTIATVPDASPSGIINCFSAADPADDLRYGKTAYALSHYYTTDNDISERDGYVHSLYANNDGMGGDWRYARTSSTNARYRRTAAPNYANMQTSHNTNHAGDYGLTQHDCLFFGQELAPTAEKKHPVHIDDEKINESNWRETNRVYRTTGYYQSTDPDKFHYNKAAWAMQPTLTAIDFTADNATVPGASAPGSTGFYGKTDDRPASLTSFNSDHNGTVTPYSNATTGKVTQNLLVYNNNGEEAFTQKVLWGTPEVDVKYHNIVKKGSTATYEIENFHLVDKQDFCAPIAFNVTNRAWYERQPAYCAESTNDAWEGIVLPFTATKVEASLNGEITHFYGNPGTTELLDDETEVAADFSNVDPAKNFHTLHHEYWLRGFVSVQVPGASAPGVTANFQRPGEGLFYPSDPSDPSKTSLASIPSYNYPANSYLTGLSDYNKKANPWYTTSQTYADYLPLTANIPYIVSFPGERFYEFDLTGQTITFSSEGVTTIPASPAPASGIATVPDVSPSGTIYAHAGTFLHVDDAPYGIQEASDNAGTIFSSDVNAVLPFRTYMTTVAAASAKASFIMISSDEGTELIPMISPKDEDTEPGDADVVGGKMMKVHTEGGSIVITANYAGNALIHNATGGLVRAVTFKEGTNRYSGLAEGLYIVGGKKVIISRR